MAIAECDGRPLSPDDHSELEPPLPIPNRTVKRLSADDSEHFARESRTSSGNSQKKGSPSRGSLFCWASYPENYAGCLSEEDVLVAPVFAPVVFNPNF